MNNDFDFSVLEEWAENLLNSNGKGEGTRLPLLRDRECVDGEVVSIREIQILSCPKPYRLCERWCNPFHVQILIPPDKSEFGLKMNLYKTILEKIAMGEGTIELMGEFFVLCRDMHHLADLAGQRVGLVRNTLRYKQKGFCIFPGCKKQRGLHMHHCLAKSLGGEDSEDNCVLVCPQHHPQLEQFRSKTELMKYLSKDVKV